MIVADSDVLIDFLRGKGPQLERFRTELARGRLATTAISAFELEAGARSRRQREAVEALLAAVEILPLRTEAARSAGRIHRDLAEQGRGIGMADCLIAAICLESAGALLTRNLRHFDRIEGLTLVRAGD